MTNNIDIDQTKIMTVLHIVNAFSTFRLVIVILMVSYFIGIFFYIFSDLTNNLESVQHKGGIITGENGEQIKFPSKGTGENFIDYYKLESFNPYERAVIMTYYAFTTLSTVGLGDYHPKSDFERLLISLVLIFGVAIFSYIMGSFVAILIKMKTINAAYNDGDQLSKFFGLIHYFNKGKNIDKELRQRVEAYFDYRWINDRNQAITEEEDVKILNELPTDVKRRVFSDFLHRKFLLKYKRFFLFKNHFVNYTHCYFNWRSDLYQNFMCYFL